METKTKLLKILPYWLIVLALIITLESGAVLLAASGSQSADSNQAPKPPAAPLVLGASTAIRGEPVLEEPPVAKSKDFDVSIVSAKSFLAFDLQSGQILLEKNPKAKLGIASLTKLMTAWAAYQTVDLNKTFTVSQKGTSDISPSLGLLAGDEVKVLDVFNSMVIGSSNDAAAALADFTAGETGENFVSLMNTQAKTLEMTATRFSNPFGFDSQSNYSTADDLKKLITASQKLSAFASLGRKTEYDFTGSAGLTYRTEATNKLLKKHPDISAIKTGYTLGSQGAMAARIKISGRDIITIVLGSQDREGDTLKLKNQLLDSFRWN